MILRYIRSWSTRMLIRRKLAGVVGKWRHVAPRRFDLSSARIVGRSMWAIGAGSQEARLSLARTMGCNIDYVFFFRLLLLFWIPHLCSDIMSPKVKLYCFCLNLSYDDKCIRPCVLCRIRTDMIWHDIRLDVGAHVC